jgi:hypothetical protein
MLLLNSSRPTFSLFNRIIILHFACSPTFTRYPGPRWQENREPDISGWRCWKSLRDIAFECLWESLYLSSAVSSSMEKPCFTSDIAQLKQ